MFAHHRTEQVRWERRWVRLALIALTALLAARATAEPTAPATAPSPVEYTGAGGTATVSGTSTLHDWSAKSATINGTLKISGPWTAAGPNLQAVELAIPVNTLKSTEGSGMDKTMYDALKMNSNPVITYHLAQANLKSSPSKDDPKYRYEAFGQLTIASAGRGVNLTLEVQPTDDNTLTIRTQTRLKMTDFGIKPPTAMLGMIESGDDVTVDVTWQLVRRSQ
jgi:polyisoprenoid-binding protein YceI